MDNLFRDRLMEAISLTRGLIEELDATLGGPTEGGTCYCGHEGEPSPAGLPVEGRLYGWKDLLRTPGVWEPEGDGRSDVRLVSLPAAGSPRAVLFVWSGCFGTQIQTAVPSLWSGGSFYCRGGGINDVLLKALTRDTSKKAADGPATVPWKYVVESPGVYAPFSNSHTGSAVASRLVTLDTGGTGRPCGVSSRSHLCTLFVANGSDSYVACAHHEGWKNKRFLPKGDETAAEVLRKALT